MAKMLPPETGPETVSNAERRLFTKIRTDLPDGWTVLHSLGLSKHARKPWAEIDFVLIGPMGVFCLEVKGGRVAREGGVWTFTDASGRESRKNEGPFEQVGSAAAALAHYFADKKEPVWNVVRGYGVLTPDITFAIEGPDVDIQVVFDVRDVARPFTRYVERLAEHWRHQLGNQRGGREHAGLSPVDVARLTQLLRPDFDLRPSLRTRIGLVRDELLRLTEQQYRVLDELAENERIIIRGSAGSGKTLLAVEEARRLARAGARVLFTCFNRPLAANLRQALGDLSGIQVDHMHGLMRDIIEEAKLQSRIPSGVDPEDVYAVFYPEVAVEALGELDRLASFDYLIVDEAQDLLLNPYLDVLDLLIDGGLESGRWRVFLDPKQNIFFASSPEGLARLLAAHPAQARLTVNCRNTAAIATHTALLSGIAPEETLVVEGPAVETYWFESTAAERRELERCLNRLLSGGVAPSEIRILGRRPLESTCLSTPLRGLPFPIRSDDGRLPGGYIPYSTVWSYKGLESDVVVLIDVDEITTEQARADLYVASSRARALLCLFMASKVRTDYQDQAREFGMHLASSEDDLSD